MFCFESAFALVIDEVLIGPEFLTEIHIFIFF